MKLLSNWLKGSPTNNEGSHISILPDGSVKFNFDAYLRSEEGQKALKKYSALGERIMREQKARLDED